MSRPNQQSGKRRALILTAVAEEHRAVSAHLRDLVEKVNSRGTIYEVGFFDTPSGPWEVVLAQTGMDDVDAAIVAARAIFQFRPSVILVVGIAVGLMDKVNLGDVVVATQLISFGTGKIDSSNEFPTTRRLIVASHRMQQRAAKEALREAWPARRIPALLTSHVPQVHLGSIASGELITKIGISPELMDRKILAFETERYGLLNAICDANVDSLIIRGITDLSSNIKQPEWRKAAASNASAFAFEVLARLDVESIGTEDPTEELYEDLAQSYISRFCIAGLRSVTEVEWQVDKGPGWHVLIGHNGAGKTSVLRAIALALFSRRETDALRQDWAHWLPASRDSGSVDVTLASSDGLPIARSIRLVRLNSNLSSPGAIEDTSYGRETTANVFSTGYGPFRRFHGGDPEMEEQIRPWPHLSRHLTLFKESAALAESLTWLKDLRFKALEGLPAGEFLEDVKAFVNGSELLPRGVRLSQVSSDAVTFEDIRGCVVEIHELSDGFRSMLSLVLDLVRHMAVAYGPAGVFSRTDPRLIAASGIVLIDEVDVHLHPTWQHRIGEWFCTHFPAVQFIVATHSLLICQSADTVYLLPRPGTEDRARMLTGIELDRIRYGNVLDAYSTGVFGLGVDRSEESKRMLKRLAFLNTKELEQNLTSEETTDQEYLRSVLPTAVRRSDSTDQGPNE